MSIHLNIKRIAKQKKITQKELAQEFECTENQMTNYLTGRTKIIADHVPTFARRLRVPITDLFEEDEDLKTLLEPPVDYNNSECELCDSKNDIIKSQKELIEELKGQRDYFKAKYEEGL